MTISNVRPYLPEIVASVVGAAGGYLAVNRFLARLQPFAKLAIVVASAGGLATGVYLLKGRASVEEEIEERTGGIASQLPKIDPSNFERKLAIFWTQAKDHVRCAEDQRVCLPLFTHSGEKRYAGLLIGGQPVFAGFNLEGAEDLVGDDEQVNWEQVDALREAVPIRLVDDKGRSIPLTLDGVEQLLGIAYLQEEEKSQFLQEARAATVDDPLEIQWNSKGGSSWAQFWDARVQLGAPDCTWIPAIRRD